VTEHEQRAHPSPERLAAWREGRLPTREAEDVARGHAACPLCRLETRRQDRFANIAADAELAAEAEWPQAEAELQRAFAARVRPALPRRRVWAPRSRRAWYVPAAAAAAVLVVLLARAPQAPLAPWPGPDRDAVRGHGPAPAIALVAPLGDVPSAPTAFRWREGGGPGTFTVTVFTPALETIARLTTTGPASTAVPDSLRWRLEPGVVYLWRVEVRRELSVDPASGNGWFRIAPAGP